MNSYRDSTILIFGDNASDLEIVQSVLRLEYKNLKTCRDSEAYHLIYDKVKPQILILSFKSLETCESVYLTLHRRSDALHATPHKALVLCSKEHVNSAYKLCHDGVFDDYILFWPLVHDAKRLPMSVHLALESLAHLKAAQPLEEIASLARRAEQLGDQLTEQINKGRIFTENARTIAVNAEAAMNGALHSFTKDFVDSIVGDASLTRDHSKVSTEVKRIGDKTLLPAVEEMLAAQAPIKKWAKTITSELEVPLQSAMELAQKAKMIRPRVLLVDDDELVRRIVAHMLRMANLEVHSVGSLASSRQLLKVFKPDIVLLDYMLPDGRGVNLLQEIKKAQATNKIPVVMLTGKSEKQVIVDCMANGANDFIVKPVQKEALIKKVLSFVVQ